MRQLADRLAELKRLKANAPEPHKNKAPENIDWYEKLRTDPAVQNRFLAYQRSGLVMKYGPLFHRLGLTPAQIAECEDNLMKRQEVYLDEEEVARTQHLTPAESGPLQHNLLEPYRTAQAALLGQDGMDQLETYDRSFHWEAMVDGFIGAATVAGVPLTPSQVQLLSSSVAQASQTPLPTASGMPQALDWENVDSQASAFLAPAQMTLFKTSEYNGPFGEGSRFQDQLNNAISLADAADRSSNR